MITSGGESILHYAVDCGVLPPIVRMLRVDDPKIVLVALEAVTAILEAGQKPGDDKPYTDKVEEASGVEALEALQQHANNDIYEKAVSIVETYFGGEEDEDENLAPAVAEGAKSFTFGAATPANHGNSFNL